MNELKQRLLAVPDTYYDFIVTVLTYAKKSQCKLNNIMNYLDLYPDAHTSDVLTFLCDSTDFLEDSLEGSVRVLN